VSVEAMGAAIADGWAGTEASVLVAHEPLATYPVSSPPPADPKPGR
jgi:hypothetical protein